MGGLKAFRATLQQQIAITDTEWRYNVQNLPTPGKLTGARLVKSIQFTSSVKEQHIELRLETAPSNRVTWLESLDRFLLLSFGDFRLREPALRDGQVVLAAARDSSEYISKLLKTGIKLNGVQYYFVGHSNSQLKSRSCFMFAATRQEITAKLEAMGDFSGMKTVAKKAKRIGLLFSSAEMATMLDADRCEDIDDVTLGDYCFTDGCGLISKQLAKIVAQRKNVVFRNQRYLPSVFQIRYRGYKGVLMIDDAMHGKIQARFRHSMRKFTAHGDTSLSVVDYSKPYTFGFLNDEIVLLLSALSISSGTLLGKQKEYLDFLDRVHACQIIDSFKFFSFTNEIKLAERLLMDGVEAVKPALRGLVRQEQAKLLSKHEEQRCRIMIPQSRLLFGVCDPSGTPTQPGRLKPGECFVRVTLDGTGDARTLINTEVLVTRNPCLHPGDLQKFRAVDVPEWTSSLVDCIVFPISGKRPSADLMSGGDLDGDKFFVTWDPEIIPRTISRPAAYPGAKERQTFQAITDDDRAEFFAKYNNMSLGRVKNLYLKWARLRGPMSAECQQLNRLFSQCVDGNRIKVPQSLEDPPEPSAESSTFILDILHDAASSHIRTKLAGETSLFGLSEPDMIELLLNRESLAISEYELVQLVLRKCNLDGLAFSEYAPFFNFQALTDEQKAWLLCRMPPIEGMPSLIRNALLQSDLVLPSELSRFRLENPRLHWKSVFRSSEDRLGRFLSSVSRSLELFHKKIIILQADERLTLMIYIPQKINKATEVDVSNRIRVFAMPRSSGPGSVKYRVVPTKSNSRVYCDDSTFQLYEAKRGNTFVYLTRGSQDRALLQNLTSVGDRRRQAQIAIDAGINFDIRASVALNKISEPIRQHVGRMNRAGILAAEIYVISNRDVESMRYLDQWLEYIDTDKDGALPLFEPVKRDYRVPTLETVDRAGIPQSVANVALDGDVSYLRKMRNVAELCKTLELLNNVNQSTRLRDVCAEMISISVRDTGSIDRLTVSRTILHFLPDAPFLTELYLRSQLWELTKESLSDESDMVFQRLCNQLILHTNRMQNLARPILAIVLRELKQMSIQHLVELSELVALTVEHPEFALDVLLECIEPECSRLILATPQQSQRLVKCLCGIALDHIEEASSGRTATQQTFDLTRDGLNEGFEVVKATFRIDAPGGHPRTGDHVRLIAASRAENTPFDRPYAMDALVISASQGGVRFRCFHRVPGFVAESTWKLRHCGSFVTSKAMFDAVAALYATKAASCRLYRQLVGTKSDARQAASGLDVAQKPHPDLNLSQNKALAAVSRYPLTLLWGPPGTGKTHTGVRILKQLLAAHPDHRFLVTAPTHNAIDNLMQRFIQQSGPKLTKREPLRVSTDVSRVNAALRQYTCDAMVGKDLSEGFAGRSQAQKKVKESSLIFTTCAGAGLGLLRPEEFGIVIVDEASQITEPGTLIPLTKGCQRAVLVGDHVQLRSTVQRHAALTGFDVSLFERLYTSPDRNDVGKVMLDTQYRMHPDLCAFSSAAFYEGKLQTASGLDQLKVPQSQFPWPQTVRKVFLPCADTEDIGRQSKSNQGQVRVCKALCKLLRAAKAPNGLENGGTSNEAADCDIAILTPYTRQRELLQKALPGFNVSSIDSFQGREANIVVFVTVRSNAHHDIGFLSDMRRLNVVMTRARAGVVIIGHRGTLVQQSDGSGDEESKRIWRQLINSCEVVDLGEQSG